MRLFAKIVNVFQLLTTYAKSSILDVSQDPEYVCDYKSMTGFGCKNGMIRDLWPVTQKFELNPFSLQVTYQIIEKTRFCRLQDIETCY